ncbi:MAG TPA: hypothetical protein DCW29_04325 [Janthinobacterium sp.]|nr:hypothetical protein [Janthinobacterium sp.]
MMRTSKFWQISALLLLAHTAGAQTPAATPPKLDKLEEGDGAPITVTAKPSHEQSQQREQGKVTSVKVTSGGSTYYVKPNSQVGTAQPGDAFGSGNRGTQWQVMEFDLGKKKQKQTAEGAAATTPPPPAK